MTVQELIEQLGKCPQNATVQVANRTSGGWRPLEYADIVKSPETVISERPVVLLG
ncbi:hypothetical protein L2449_29085 [Mesorhizobium muleiense]|uniref:hypothetical protein n=1 Tax=Mesorhizobium muleiense TaxID=1004279 RepID=UPI001F320C0C|nr:hypothetical protein [Mesorhizobium muleiense]MCF6120884.1 hypothetical protein [Mesorhizobium muleiense]